VIIDSRPELKRRPVPRWALALPVVVVLVATATAAGMVAWNSSARTPWVGAGTAKVGEKAPSFTSWDLDGNRFNLGDFKGKPVLLTFWATWCTACQDELPALQQVRDGYRASGLTVLAVDFRETDGARMRQFLAGLHVDFRAAIDPQGAIAAAYGVDIGLPVNVWLDRDQTVARIMVGAQPHADLAAAAALVATG
jgi:peroxiredoxin